MHIALHEAGHAVIACVLWPDRLLNVMAQYESEDSFVAVTTTD